MPNLSCDPLCILGRASKVWEDISEMFDDFSLRNFGEVFVVNLASNTHEEPTLSPCIKKSNSSAIIKLGAIPFVEEGVRTLLVKSDAMLWNGSSQKSMHNAENRDE